MFLIYHLVENQVKAQEPDMIFTDGKVIVKEHSRARIRFEEEFPSEQCQKHAFESF